MLRCYAARLRFAMSVLEGTFDLSAESGVQRLGGTSMFALGAQWFDSQIQLPGSSSRLWS